MGNLLNRLRPHRTGQSVQAGRQVKLGVATRLFLAFCGVTLMTVLVAIIGTLGLRDARETLNTSNQSFEQVSLLLDDTTSALYSASEIITATGATLDATIHTMEETSDRVNTLNSIDLPAVINIGIIREALTAVAVGERTLLMRQLYDMEIRNVQRRVIDEAFHRAEAALVAFEQLVPQYSAEKREAWRRFLASWNAWQSTHDRLMGQYDLIDDLLARRVRGGFEFEEVAKEAFAIAFGEGQDARVEVNARLDAVVQLISDSARESARFASTDTTNATRDAIVAKDSMTNANRQIDQVTAQMANLNTQVRETTEATTTSIETTDRVRMFFIICTTLGFIVSILLALWQTNYQSRPIRHAAQQMDLLAKGMIDRDVMAGYVNRSDEIGALARSVGDMIAAQRDEVKVAGDMATGDFSGSVRLRSDADQLGLSLSEMMRITHDALSRVNRHVEQVTDGAEAISSASQNLSSGAERAAQALVEIHSSTTAIGEQTHQNAQNASRANDFARASRDVAERGYAAVEEMVASMQEIQASSAHIARIVKLIDDIAFQTNLLALNAAVEAARAGRQGKGFSVVAGEVRNLASRSAKAARETAVLVEETVKRVENGAAIAMRTDEAFKEILDNAQQTTHLYEQIADASQQQSQSIDQIASGLAQIDLSTQQNSRYAAEMAEAAQRLSRQTGELRQMMVRFQLQNRGQKMNLNWNPQQKKLSGPTTAEPGPGGGGDNFLGYTGFQSE